MTVLTVRRSAAVVLFAAACGVIAGCSSTEGSNGSGADAGGASSAAAPAAAAIDGCSLISPEEISTLLGTTVEGKSTGTDPEMADCMWENPANYESVSLEIGAPNTAVNGTVPPPEPGFPEVGTPGPDGMRFMGGGSVQFAAAGRLNMVQVAVLSMSGDAANTAAVDLARKIGPKLPE